MARYEFERLRIMNQTDTVSFASLADLSEGLRYGRLTSTELVKHFLSRFERLDLKLHAFVSVDAPVRCAAADSIPFELNLE